jgi:hypothetical protein
VIIIPVSNHVRFFLTATLYCGPWLLVQSPTIPFGLWPMCAHFLFTLPSNPLQLRPSIYSVVFLFSLLLPLKLPLFISHSSLVHPFIISIRSYSQRLYTLHSVCCLLYNLRLLICSYFISLFFFHATWIFLTVFLFEYSNRIQSCDAIVQASDAWSRICLTWKICLINLISAFRIKMLAYVVIFTERASIFLAKKGCFFKYTILW